MCKVALQDMLLKAVGLGQVDVGIWHNLLKRKDVRLRERKLGHDVTMVYVLAYSPSSNPHDVCLPLKLQTRPKGKDDLVIRLLFNSIDIERMVFLKFFQPIQTPVLGLALSQEREAEVDLRSHLNLQSPTSLLDIGIALHDSSQLPMI